MDAPAYLHSLAEKLRAAGVPIIRKTMPSIEHAYQAIPATALVVNCTALGAKSLIGVEDQAVQPIRGQTILVRAPNAKATISLMDRTFILFVCVPIRLIRVYREAKRFLHYTTAERQCDIRWMLPGMPTRNLHSLC